jgi:hypothetical protein
VSPSLQCITLHDSLFFRISLSLSLSRSSRPSLPSQSRANVTKRQQRGAYGSSDAACSTTDAEASSSSSSVLAAAAGGGNGSGSGSGLEFSEADFSKVIKDLAGETVTIDSTIERGNSDTGEAGGGAGKGDAGKGDICLVHLTDCRLRLMDTVSFITVREWN